ncbi:MAG: ATP-binding protein, partial [Rhodobacteraceae bacterium]|nr:ATP-binding protein [Paracoccaceae bacterium]
QKSELADAPLVFVIDGNCRIIARGLNSYLYYYVDYREPPINIVEAITPYQLPDDARGSCAPARTITTASADTYQSVRFTAEGEGAQPRFVVFETTDSEALSALVRLENAYNRYLIAIVDISPEIFTLNRSLINNRRTSSDILQQIYGAVFTYSLITLGVALIIVLFMMQFGVMIANRLARPVYRMSQTAQEVADGNLAVRINNQGSDEIAKFSRIFDSMIGHLEKSLHEQIELRSMAEQRERNFSEVLANVTAGVIGIDSAMRIVFMNRSTGSLLALDHEAPEPEDGSGLPESDVRDLFPECTELFVQIENSASMFLQDQIRIIRAGQYRDLLVRLTRRRSGDGEFEGYVIVIDDVSKLIQAQEKATWSSVAQQIAHEINNHMTPITMSLGQIESRIGKLLDADGAAQLKKYTSMITESIEGLIRISREFSDFARLPSPETEPCDIVAVCESVIPMTFDATGDTAIRLETSHPVIHTRIDPTLIRQALVNIIKNAYEGISAQRARQEAGDKSWNPDIQIRIRKVADTVEIAVIDNGTGFPATVPMGDFMIPFKTFRSGGTGLGLAYVDRIVKGHGGELKLMPAPVTEEGDSNGAMVVMTLPLLATDI